jgi:integrase
LRFLRPARRRPEYAEAMLAKDVTPEWAGRDVRTIKPREVIALLDKIVARGSRVVANRVAGLLGQLFKFAVHRSLLEISPVQLLYRPGGREHPRERALSDDELRAFLRDPRACTRYERLEHVILVLLLTGQRRGELAAARWSEVDLETGKWEIPASNSKIGRAQTVPLSDWAAEEFKALKREAESSPHVLPDRPGGDAPIDAKQLTRSLAKCRARFKARGVDAFTLHDLRRTCRTGLARLKVAPHIAERVLGHAQERIPGTYDVHDYLEEKRAALEKWAAHLQELR